MSKQRDESLQGARDDPLLNPASEHTTTVVAAAATAAAQVGSEEDVDRNRFGYDYEYQNVKKDTRTFRFFSTKPNRLRYRSEPRKITSGRPDESLPNNHIQTNRYTCLNFIPKNLYLQFSKLANVYFLVIGILQLIPQISISQGIPVIFLPLACIVTISGTKDFYEDYKKLRSDRHENDQIVQVFDQKSNMFKHVTWKEIKPGNIIKVMKNNYFPADILLLMTSDQHEGICYIETKNLDGETNLESKQAEPRIREKYIRGESMLGKECVIVHYESPNKIIYRFDGRVETKSGDTFPLSYTNIALRGCCLKNTEYVIGMALYTGHQSKIMYMLYKAGSKKSTLEQLIGKLVIQIFLLQVVICIVCSLIYFTFYSIHGDYLTYLLIKEDDPLEGKNVVNILLRLGNWILICTNFVPISLIVTLESVKIIQGVFMSNDEKMGGVTVQASNLNEELGQINYIFSDKTGTLTKNCMQFKKIAIGDVIFGNSSLKNEEPLAGAASVVGGTEIALVQDPQPPSSPLSSSTELTDEEILRDYPRVENVDFRDRAFMEKVKNPSDPDHQNIKRVLFLLAACHSVQSTIDSDGSTVYTASSPDEFALVNFSKFAGVEFIRIEKKQNDSYIVIRFNSKDHYFLLLHVFEFDSNRQRQSVIVQDPQTQAIFIFCKGADSVMTQNVNENTDPSMLRSLNESLKKFGSQGLRTLMLGQREIPQDVYDAWLAKLKHARTLSEGKELEIEQLQDEMEKQLVIIGATAIEDKLQDEVADTIKALKDAGIKIWVLTGDKIETAINIAYSCKLLDDSLEKVIIDVEEENEVQKFLQDTLTSLEEAERIYKEAQLLSKNRIDEEALINHALIISGFALNHISKSEIKTLIMKIVKYCKCILCCRVSPKQKQQIVSAVRSMEKGSITLAIGDGANDVNMITAAHVGIGIMGVEGQQAARASDYSITEFRHIRRLLFYHGRESYRKNSNLVCYNFYKNVLLVMPQFWFGWTNWFSGQTLYNSFIYQLFNIFFASLPIVVYAIFDEEYPDTVLVTNSPKNYYEQGIKNQLFNSREFWEWMLVATIQSGLIVVDSLFTLELNFVTPNGQSQWFWATGTMVFGLVVVVSNIKIITMSTDHSLGSLMITAGSILCYLVTWVIVRNILCIFTTSFFDWAINLYRKWEYEYDENKQSVKVDERPKHVKTNRTFPIKLRTFGVEIPKKQNGFVKDETKATYAAQEQKRNYYSEFNTGYAFNQIDKNKINRKHKEGQMF